MYNSFSNLSVPFGRCSLHSISMDGQALISDKSPPCLADIGKVAQEQGCCAWLIIVDFPFYLQFPISLHDHSYFLCTEINV